jgi:hypothetical protein
VNATIKARRAAEAERIARLSTAMSDRITRQPGDPDPVLYKTASVVADLADVLLATIEGATP